MHMVCGPAKANGEREVRKFGTTTLQLKKLVHWLLEQGVESVAMESTSVYWIPLYELLESGGIEVLLVNARQLGNVPGRKTDVLDCQWIQLLHSCGLLRGSFRPNEAICYLRALKRQSANLMAERTKAVQWMQKALDQMNVQVREPSATLQRGKKLLEGTVRRTRRGAWPQLTGPTRQEADPPSARASGRSPQFCSYC